MQYPQLQAAHHFLFDLPLEPGVVKPKYVFMGINPGEHPSDHETVCGPTEETSEFDFHEHHGNGRKAVRFTNMILRVLGTLDVVQSELFFWSSKNETELKERFGRLETNPHLEFCTAMNKRLLELRQPEAVVFSGLGKRGLASKEYGLTLVDTENCNTLETHKLVEVATDGERPWYFVKHLTGGYGMSNAQLDQIKDYIERRHPSSGAAAKRAPV